MLEFVHQKAYRPDEVFLEIIMKQSLRTHFGTARGILSLSLAVIICLGLVFWIIEAGPVLPFLIIQTALLYTAYRFGVRHGRISETLSFSANDLIVRKFGPSKKASEAIRLQPCGINLDLAEDPAKTCGCIFAQKVIILKWARF